MRRSGRLPNWWPWPVAAVLGIVLIAMLAGSSGETEEDASSDPAPDISRRWPAPDYPAARADAAVGDLSARVAEAVAPIVAPLGRRIGVWIGGPAPGEDLFAHGADGAFVPASNMKLLSSGAAWLALGEDHRLATRMLASGSAEDGILRGDLVVVGGGDSSLSPRVTNGDAADPCPAFARALADLGIRRVEGDIVLDDGLFDRNLAHPDWGDPVTYGYRAQVTALLLNDSCIRVTAAPGPSAGAPARLDWEPRCDAVTVTGAPKTAAKGTPDPFLRCDRAEGSNAVTVRGRVNRSTAGQSGLCAIHDPTTVFGSVLARCLKQAGVAFSGKIRHEPGAGGRDGLREIARVETPLRRAILAANTESHNLTAECLLKLVGVRMENQGSWEAGGRAVADALREQGIATEGLVVADGSGLSVRNQCTSRQIGRWLRYLLAAPGGESFRKTLAAGGEGTLHHRLRDAPIGKRIRLKTGYVTVADGNRRIRARALSGYVDAGANGPILVSILSRDVPRETLDRIIRAIVAAGDGG